VPGDLDLELDDRLGRQVGCVGLGSPILEGRLLVWTGHREEGFDEIVDLDERDPELDGQLVGDRRLAGPRGPADQPDRAIIRDSEHSRGH